MHNGWAVLVTVAADRGAPVVVDRRRVELMGSELPSQPYHHEALDLELQAAEELVREVKESALLHARDALSQLRADLATRCALAGLVLRQPRPLPETLAEILESHPATLIADAEMYLAALSGAAEELGISAETHPRSGELDFAAGSLGESSDRVSDFVSGLRATLGPPWQKDHKSAAAAAMGSLARLQKLALPAS